MSRRHKAFETPEDRKLARCPLSPIHLQKDEFRPADRHCRTKNLRQKSAEPVVALKPACHYQSSPKQQGEMSCVEVIVYYMGTIALPKNSRHFDHRMHSIGNSIKRLKEACDKHRLIYLKLDISGVWLFDLKRKILMHHLPENVASFGVSPADDTLFYMVTHEEDDDSAGLSCKIFSVDLDIVSHQAHRDHAKRFGIRCEVNIDNDHCTEFPSSGDMVDNLFRRFFNRFIGYKGVNNNLDAAMFVPPGFESRLNLSGLNGSWAHADSSHSSCSDENVTNNTMSPWQYECRRRSNSTKSFDERETTAVFPAERYYDRALNLSGTAEPHLLSSRQSNETLLECCGHNYHDLAMVDDSLDQDCKDNFQYNAETLRQKSRKFLVPPNSNQTLHISKFLADETDLLDPESPMPLLRVRAKKATNVRTNIHQSSRLVVSHRTSTPNRRQPVATRTQNIGNENSYAKTKRVVLSSKQTPADKLKLSSVGPQQKRTRFDNAKLLASPETVAKRSPERQKLEKLNSSEMDMAKNSTESMADVKTSEFENLDSFSCENVQVKAENRGNLTGLAKLPVNNLSFHGSLESVVQDSSESSEPINKLLGSCKELAPGLREAVGRAASWAVAFDNLLNDKAGLATFREHLKREFSEENIIFWLKVKEYKTLPENERKARAVEIYNSHVDPMSDQCINIEQLIVKAVQSSLNQAGVDIFDAAQTHIHLLMKHDSYSRFKTSQLYKDAVLSEMEGRPFTFSGEEETRSTSLRPKETKNSGFGKPQEDRRRSIMFWQRKKFEQPDKSGEVFGSSAKNQNLSKVGRSSNVPKTSLNSKSMNEILVKFPDGSANMLKANNGEKISHVLVRLGDKLKCGLNFTLAIDPATNLVLDVTKDIKSLPLKRINLVDCVLFRLTLPNEKSFAVRCRFKQTVASCLGPIFRKYGFGFDKVVMHVTGTGVIVKEKMLIDSVDCCHVLVESLFDSKAKKKGLGGTIGRRSGAVYQQQQPVVPSLFNRSLSSPFEVQCQLEELFRDAFDSDVDFTHIAFDELGAFNLEKLNKLNGRGGSLRLSNLFPRWSVDQSRLSSISKRPTVLVTKDEPFMKMLMSAQGRQLNAQRGKLTKEDMILPDFLKEQPNNTISKSPLGLKDLTDSSLQTPKIKMDSMVFESVGSENFVPGQSLSSSAASSSTDLNFYANGTNTDVSYDNGNLKSNGIWGHESNRIAPNLVIPSLLERSTNDVTAVPNPDVIRSQETTSSESDLNTTIVSIHQYKSSYV